MGSQQEILDLIPHREPFLWVDRINSAKFKRTILPGDKVEIKVRITESLSSVYFFKGTMKVDGKVAVQVDFACTVTS